MTAVTNIYSRKRTQAAGRVGLVLTTNHILCIICGDAKLFQVAHTPDAYELRPSKEHPSHVGKYDRADDRPKLAM